MSLESNQQLQNQMHVLIGNASPSLDPQTILLEGAKKLAAGKTLGLSEDEIFTALNRQLRMDRQELTIENANNALARFEQAKAALPNYAVETPSFVTTDLNDPGVAKVFGVTTRQDEDQTLRSGDRDFVGPEEQERRDGIAAQREKRDAKRRADYEQRRERAGLRVFENQPSTYDGMIGETVAPQVRRVSDYVVPMEGRAAVDVAGLLTAEQRQRQRERDSVLALGASERARLAPGAAIRAQNSRRAGEEAALAFQTGGAFPRQPLGIDRRGEIMEIMGDASTVPTAVQVKDDFGLQDGSVPIQGVYVDPHTGAPITQNIPLSTVVAGSNTPNTGQQLNAPPTQSANEFVTQLAYAGTPYSENQPMRQVPIMETLGMLDRNLNRTFPQVASDIGPIRSIDNLQAAVDAVLRSAAEEGRELASMQGGKAVFEKQPGVAQALDAMGVKNPNAQEAVAIALRNLVPGKTYGGDDIVYGSLPRGGTPTGGARSMRADTPLVKAMQASEMPLEPDTVARTMGATTDSPIPKTTTTRPMEELVSQRRVQFVLESLGANRTDQQIVFNAAVRQLRAAGISQPTMGQVSDLLMRQYAQKEQAGELRRLKRGPRKGEQKTLDEAALQRSIDSAAGRRPQQEADLARSAASKPRISETDRNLLSIIEMIERARPQV